MRLSRQKADQIMRIAKSIFGAQTEAYLFGSRIKDQSKGGDIDLLIRTESSSNTFRKKLTFIAQLKKEIGDQKIDVIIRPFSTPESNDIIYQDALNGIRL